MRTSRRDFFRLLSAAAAGAVIDPDELLWRPGKLISIPAPSIVEPPIGPFCRPRLEPDWFVEQAVQQLKRHLVMAHAIRTKFEPCFLDDTWPAKTIDLDAEPGPRSGDVVNVRLPNQFSGGLSGREVLDVGKG